MSPLSFVNWRSVNAQFRALMWVAAAILALVILMHLSSFSGAPAHHVIMHGGRYRAGVF